MVAFSRLFERVVGLSLVLRFLEQDRYLMRVHSHLYFAVTIRITTVRVMEYMWQCDRYRKTSHRYTFPLHTGGMYGLETLNETCVMHAVGITSPK